MTNEELEALVSLRRRAGVRQSDIAQKLEISAAMLSLSETGARDTPDDFEARYRAAVQAVAEERLAAAVAA